MTKKAVYIALVVLIALALRLYIAFSISEVPADDALEYDNLAVNIVSGKGYVGADGLPTSFRPPFYPAALSAVYFVFGHSYLAVRVAQSILGALTVFLIYLVGREAHSDKVGIAAASLCAVYPSYVVLTKFLFTEGLFTFLLVLSAYLFMKLKKRMLARTAILLGVTLGALTLTRSSAIMLPLFYVTLLYFILPKDRIKKVSALSALILVFYLAAIAPWVYRNSVVHQKAVLISANGGLNFYQAQSPVEGKIFGKVPDDEVIGLSREIPDEIDRDRFLFAQGFKKVVSSPMTAAKLAFMRSLFYWGFFDWETQTGVEYNYIYGFILPFFIFGLILGLKDLKNFGILIGVIAYFFLIILVSQGTVRYRLPTEGFLFVIGAYGMAGVEERAKNKVPALLAIALYFALNLFLFVNSGATKNFLKKLMEKVGLW